MLKYIIEYEGGGAFSNGVLFYRCRYCKRTCFSPKCYCGESIEERISVAIVFGVKQIKTRKLPGGLLALLGKNTISETAMRKAVIRYLQEAE
jgi:hypothetical protein